MALLLLVQLDGHIACVSLQTGALQWRAALPGGPLSHCGRRPLEGLTEQRLWALRGGLAADCANCADLCADPIASRLALHSSDAVAECCLVARGAARCDWRIAGGLPVSRTVRRWDRSACAAHRAVTLRRVDTSQAEMDLRTGRVLSFLGGRAGEERKGNEEEDKEEEDKGKEGVSPLRLVARRMDDTRSVLLPISNGSWYAACATVELDVLRVSFDKDVKKNVPDATSSEISGLKHACNNEAVHSLTFVEQTILPDGAAEVHLHTEVGKVALRITEPAVSAFVFIPPDVPSVVNCREISVRSIDTASAAQKVFLTLMNIPLHGALVPSRNGRISGFFHAKRQVLFVESSPSASFSDVCDQDVENCNSASTESDEEREEEESGLFKETENEEEEEEEGEEAEEAEEGDFTHITSRSSNASMPGAVRTTELVPHMKNSTSSTAVITTRVGNSHFDENFEVITLLGRGVSGVVVLTRHYITGVFYAVKIMLTRDYFSEEAAFKEVRLHAMLRNTYLVRYFSCWSEALTPLRMAQLSSARSHSAKGARDMASGPSQECLDFSDQDGGWSKCLALTLPYDGSSYLAGNEDDVFDDDVSGENSLVSSSSASSASRSLRSARVVFLQMEYCQTTLAHRLGSRKCIDRVENIIIAMHLFRGLQYLHNHGCLHRDVKPTNVFLDYHSQLSPTGDIVEDDDIDDDDDDDDIDSKDNVDCSENWDSTVQVQHNGKSPISREVVRSDATESMFRPSIYTAFELLRVHPRFSSLIDQLHKRSDKFITKKLRKEVCSFQKWLRRRHVQVRLGDFGLSKLLREQRIDVAGYFNRNAMNTVGTGSPLYSSPEQLEGNVCTPSSDAFSGGVVFAEMYMQPKTVSERIVELRRVREGFFPDAAMLEAYPELRIVRGLTHQNPKSRTSLADATRALSDVLGDILSSFFLACAGE